MERELRAVGIPVLAKYAIPAVLVGVSFALYLLVLAAYGIKPADVLRTSAEVLTEPGGLKRSFVKALPILLSALGLALTFKMGFWNIGAEGQLLMGLLMGSGAAIFLAEGLPAPLTVLVMFAAAFAAGALWATPPALLRSTLGVNEVLTTLMLNYVAASIFNYLIHGPWRDPEAYGFIRSPPIPSEARLSPLGGAAIVLAATVSAVTILNHTRLGFEIRLVGSSYEAARAAGVSYTRVALLTMIISGGLAGLGGVMISSMMTGVLMEAERMSPGYGYTAIIAAWLARLNPIGVLASSLFLGYVVELGDNLKILYKLPSSSVMILEGVLLLAVIAAEFVERRWVGVRGRAA